MFDSMKSFLLEELEQIKEAGLFKPERVITGAQDVNITVQDGSKVLNLCANNYLGLANHPEVIQAARDSYNRWGYGLSSVRFICGTQEIHKQLEQQISGFLTYPRRECFADLVPPHSCLGEQHNLPSDGAGLDVPMSLRSLCEWVRPIHKCPDLPARQP